jgi:uncharacterized protein with NRDE domain
MCTVTFIKTNKGAIITSNRDEKIVRVKALAPQEYLINNIRVTFPKDPQAGGTWIAQTNNTCVVLLNGAEEKHISAPHYRKSRGQIVLDLISGDAIIDWQLINLENIEPFTLIVYQNDKLFQFRWNGNVKENIELNPNKAYIWSSSTLYSKEIKTKREEWFTTFLNKNPQPTPNQLIDFHSFTESSNIENGLQINRNNIYKTVSITQIEKNNCTTMNYIDLH